MRELNVADFPEFHRAVTGDAPFRWQVRLVEEVAESGWPDVLNLPTASGKTSTLEIAVFTLALEYDRPAAERRAPRRIFFVVDRRIIVDQAFGRAGRMAGLLAKPNGGMSPVVNEVAERLRRLAGPGLAPLGHERLRGGIPRANAWVRLPSQPAIIACTVDQIGSSILFRSYNGRIGMAPVHAGLAANDSLILLDEAHCSLPFLQTATAVQRYRAWSDEPVMSPFRVVSLSATPQLYAVPEASPRVFSLTVEEREDPALRPRLTASKPAALLVAKEARVPRGTGSQGERDARRKLSDEISRTALDLLLQHGCRTIGVIVNRVSTALEVRDRITISLDSNASGRSRGCAVILMTGRMRPLDREDLIEAWGARLGSKRADSPDDTPVIVVSTQSLEVGADFDFDALVTEAASVDALRQRFGRLNRVGRTQSATGAIVIAACQEKDSRDDPIYGGSLSATWQWLVSISDSSRPPALAGQRLVDEIGAVDFGIEALEPLLADSPLEQLIAPTKPAPVMLPAHIDRWVQTSPIPEPTPDPAVYLHGSDPVVPEVNVLWRMDLVSAGGRIDAESAQQVLELCPPSTLEALTVSIAWARSWMREEVETPLYESDIEGRGASDDGAEGQTKREVLVWRARKAQVIRDPDALEPGDFIILTRDTDSAGREDNYFTQFTRWDGRGSAIHDLGDRAQFVGRGKAVLRLHRRLFDTWPVDNEGPAMRQIRRLLDLLPEELDPDDLALALETLREELRSAQQEQHWLFQILTSLTSGRGFTVAAHPAGGFILLGRSVPSAHLDPVGAFIASAEAEADDDPEQLSAGSASVHIDDHCRGVASVVAMVGDRCGIPKSLVDDLVLAAALHDIGKADPRFQAVLRADGLALPVPPAEMLAKSKEMPRTSAGYRRLAQIAGLPHGFRHELVSLRLAEAMSELLAKASDRDLVLHLIASHHGYCRPFAPVISDDNPVLVRYESDGHSGEVSSATRLHQLSSGVADRFWTLVRRYGWWGLAFLEAILRTADHLRSSAETNPQRSSTARSGQMEVVG